MNQQLMVIFVQLYDEDQKSLKSVDIADCLKNYVEAHKNKTNKLSKNWQKTVKKLIDGLKRLGYIA